MIKIHRRVAGNKPDGHDATSLLCSCRWQRCLQQRLQFETFYTTPLLCRLQPSHQVGRMAGQFAKPRFDPFETQNGVKLPNYQGDIINGDSFDEKSRTPDPQRLIGAYTQSAATLNLLRAFSAGGYASIQRVTQWNLDFTENSKQGDRYMELAQRVDEALGFMVAAGLTADHPLMTTTEFWTSHECLHLPQSLRNEKGRFNI